MCILCAIASWSRRAATMLPWLVIPFIIVWALSQLFPPGYRLEVTSPRLACLGVLLSSLGWYELLMPWLSSWQARRSALLRERKLIEAQEALKWRKEATRRCRNCLTVYKVQTPGGGRFMCTYCGHISKRPVLEVPGSSAITGLAGLPPSVSCSGGNGAGTWHLLKAVRRGSRPHGSIWSRDVERNRCACLGESMNGADKCSMRQSFPAALMIILRILSLIEWVWRKLLGIRLPSANGSKGSPRVMEISADSNGSRGEKARRKANEKKQARLERERLEAEERKQREEVAWLVEERRRQRFKELEGAKKIESEMAGERETEARSVRDTGRRRKDKAKERITDPVIDRPAEQELGAADKTTVEIDDRVVSPVRTSVKVAESTKLAKVSRGIVQNHSLRYKSTTNNSARLGLLKHTGTSTTQRAPASAFKMGTLYQSDGAWKGKNDGTLMVRKMTKSAASVAPGSSSSSPKPAGAPYLSGSAWKRAPWISAWAKGSEHLTGDSSKTETGLVIGSGQSLGEVVDGRLKSFNDSASVVKPSLQPVRGTAIQPPIAPQLTCIDPLQQLFSAPSIFSLPVDFNNMGEQKPQSEIKASFLSEHTFFEAQACVTFQSSNSFAPPLTSPSLQMPMPVLDRMSTPLQPTLGGSENNFMRSNFLSPEAVYGLETFLPKGLTSESQSLTSVSISDPAINDNLIPLPFLDPIKVDESNPHVDQEDALRWVLPPVSLEKTDEDALQLPPSSPVQSLFDAETLMPGRCLL